MERSGGSNGLSAGRVQQRMPGRECPALLHQEISRLEEELQLLKQKAEEKIKLNSEDRENFKIKINGLISRIDYHLSSDR